ncbi:uncharacterized protein LOC131607369 [Vicia villosa]|uniref:uncharacterized protein LOC131607369 n=1 Tax=Vicia villosa TaxID=3911 RepID=UPI00273C6291|nr:uncharacterized protein LOC131607369 [Vicia villosa]
MKSIILKTETFLVLFMLMNVFLILEARPLSIIDTKNSYARNEVMDIFGWLSHSIGEIKQGVPVETLGGIKDSGPSSGGVGHKFTNVDTLGGIKDSGPSSGGTGHKFTDIDTLGGIKDSGPSSGGVGHKFTNRETLGGIKDSGPSPGQGH